MLVSIRQAIRRLFQLLPSPTTTLTSMDTIKPLETVVLPCDVSSISFNPPTSETTTPVINDPSTRSALQKASDLIQSSSLVVFPTETVYGLAANALSPTATSLIFQTKGRPQDNPLIVHISSLSMLSRLISPDFEIPPSYRAMMDAFWPGPLTLLFPCNKSVVPREVTAGHDTVGVRMPSHPVARALIAMSDTPLAAPSANTSGRPSPTRASHVVDDLRGKIALVLDGGPCDVGVESTVVDGLRADGHVRVLRPGGVTVEDLTRVLRGVKRVGRWGEMEKGRSEDGVVASSEDLSGRGEANGDDIKVLVHRRDYKDEVQEQQPTTPGMKYRHYSPTSPVYLLIPNTSPIPPNASQPPDASLPALSPQSFLREVVAELDDGSGGQSEKKRRLGLLSLTGSPLTTALQRVGAVDSVSLEWVQHPLGRVAGKSGGTGDGAGYEVAEAARALFDGLISLDKLSVDAIVVEGVVEEREGLAVMNRIQKAAGRVVGIHVEQSDWPDEI
ncbi:translation factor [Serendipita vermifera]|nr:translation factor [Serendipita vermifera]